MADRTVTYKMKLVPDDGNAAAAAKFAKQSLDAQSKSAAAIQKEMTRQHELGIKERIKLEQQALREGEKLRKEAGKAGAQQQMTAAAREGTKVRVALIRDEWVRVRELSTAYRELGSAIGSLPKNRIPGAASVRAARQPAADMVGPQPLTPVEQRAREREALAAERAKQREAREAFRERVKYMKDEERKVRDVERAEEDLNRKRAESKRTILEAGEGLLKMGRGLAAVGLLSEENNDKLLRGLVLVQGAFDIVSGGVKAWTAINDALKAYRATLASVVALEKAQAAAGMVSAGGARGRRSQMGNMMGTLGMGLRTTAFLAGAAGYYKFASDPTGFNEGVLDTGEYFGGDYYTQFTAKYDAGLAGMGARNRLESRRLQRGFEGYFANAMPGEGRQVVAGRRQASSESRMQGLNIQRDVEMAMAANNAERLVTIEAKRADILKEIDQFTQSIAEGGHELASDQGHMLSLQEQLVQQAQEEFSIREDIRKSAIDASRERIQGMETELSKMRDLQEREQDRYTTAAERFAQMTMEEQRQVIAAKEKAGREGTAALTRREADLLRGTGLESLRKLASQRDVAAAEAAGFGTLIGADEKAAISDRTKQLMQMQVDLNKEIEVKAKLEASPDEYAKKIIEQLRPQLAKLREDIAAQVEAQMEEDYRAKQQQQMARKVAENRAAGNR